MDEMSDPLGLRARVDAFQQRVEGTLRILEELAAGLDDAKALKPLIESYQASLRREEAAASARSEAWARIEAEWSRVGATVDRVARNDEKQDLALAQAERGLGELREKTEAFGRRLHDELLGVEQRFGSRQNEFEGRLTARLDERTSFLNETIEKARTQAEERARDLQVVVETLERDLREADTLIRQELASQAADLRSAVARLQEDVTSQVDELRRNADSDRRRLLFMAGLGIGVGGVALVIALVALVKAF